MSRATKTIDIDDDASLVRVAEEVSASGESRLLRRAGKDLAVVVPISAVPSAPGRVKTQEDYEAFLASEGGWEGKVDVDKFLEDIEESRRLPNRPPVEL